MTSPADDFDSPPPPDSWPGAGGRRSVAPHVGPPSRPAGGDSWPGAQNVRRPAPAAEEDDDDTPTGGVAGVLFPAVLLIVAFVLVGLWGWIDAGNRQAQLITVLVLIAVAAVALAVSLIRHRDRG